VHREEYEMVELESIESEPNRPDPATKAGISTSKPHGAWPKHVSRPRHCNLYMPSFFSHALKWALCSKWTYLPALRPKSGSGSSHCWRQDNAFRGANCQDRKNRIFSKWFLFARSFIFCNSIFLSDFYFLKKVN
jgi:hypothetical protein